jgi:hypothetical protein
MPDGMRGPPEQEIDLPEAYVPLAWTHLPDGTPIRYKVYYGGRGAAKRATVSLAP